MLAYILLTDPNNLFPPTEQPYRIFGVIVGLGALVSGLTSWEGKGSHPDIDERFHSLLQKIDPDESSQIWTTACFFLIVFLVFKNKPILPDVFLSEETSPKESFDAIWRYLKEQ